MSDPDMHDVQQEDARTDLLAILAAGRDLGPEMDRALADSFLNHHPAEPSDPPEPPALPQQPPIPPSSPDDDESGMAWYGIPAGFFVALAVLVLLPGQFGMGFAFAFAMAFAPALLFLALWSFGRTRHERIPTVDPSPILPPPTVAAPPMPAQMVPYYPQAAMPQTALGNPTDHFDVILMHPGRDKIAAIKAIRQLTGKSLREAKMLVDAAPQRLFTGVTQSDANRALVMLGSAGVHVSIQPVVSPAQSQPFSPSALGTPPPESPPPYNPAG